MKILINPEWLDLVKDLPSRHKAELLMCLLSYPDGNSELGAWTFMRKQIDRDRAKYEERCKNLAENRQKRWAREQTDDRNKSDAEQTDGTQGAESRQQAPESAVIVSSIESEKHIENSIDRKKDIERLLKNAARSMDADAPARYEINDDFNFDKIAERDGAFKSVFDNFPTRVLAKAQRSLYSKRYGQKLTLQQIEAWVRQEGQF